MRGFDRILSVWDNLYELTVCWRSFLIFIKFAIMTHWRCSLAIYYQILQIHYMSWKLFCNSHDRCRWFIILRSYAGNGWSEVYAARLIICPPIYNHRRTFNSIIMCHGRVSVCALIMHGNLSIRVKRVRCRGGRHLPNVQESSNQALRINKHTVDVDVK